MISTYVIYDKLTGYSKIGKTTDIKKRLSTLSTSNLNLELLVVLPTNQEKFLHKYFKEKHIEKEWFCLSLSDIEEIKDLGLEILINNL